MTAKRNPAAITKDRAGLTLSVVASVGASATPQHTTGAESEATAETLETLVDSPFEYAAMNAAVFTHVETDESGEPRVVSIDAPPARAAHMPRLRVLATVTSTPVLRRAAFRANPFCAECDERLASDDLGAVVPTDEGPRIAHLHECFAAAMLRHQPHLCISAAVGRVARGR